MSDESEATIFDAIDSHSYDNRSPKKDLKGKRNEPKATVPKQESRQPVLDTLIITPAAKPAKSPAAPTRKPSAGIIAAVIVSVVIVIVTVVMILHIGKSDNSGSDTPDAEKSLAVTDTRQPSAQDIYVSAIKDIDTNSPESCQKGLTALRSLALDSAYTPAMLEYGILIARPTTPFADLAEKQKSLGLSADLDTSTRLLSRVLEADPDNYKASYWIYNNLMTKFDRNTINPAETKQMVETFRSFKSSVDKASGDEPLRYKKAMLSTKDEDTLRAWALI